MAAQETLPPFNPYDPNQNQLLLIKPSWRNPIMTKDRVVNFLDAIEPVLEVALNEIRIRTCMNRAEYLTSYNWSCKNPIELSEPMFHDAVRQDFSIVPKQFEVTQLQPEISAASHTPKI